ncbi:MAG: SemiSWEET family transporter [Candidatus Paceibacterota bacterium]
MKIIEILALIAGVAMSFASYPQIFKIYKAKSAQNISLITFSIFLFGCIIWIIYGVSIKNQPIILSYSIGLLGNSGVLLGILKFKRS